MRAFIVDDIGRIEKNLGEVYCPLIKVGDQLRAPVRSGLIDDPLPTDPNIPTLIQQVTLRGEKLDGQYVVILDTVEDFQNAIAFYGGFEQRDFFGDT